MDYFLTCHGYLQVEYDQVGSAYAAALLDLAKDKDLLEPVHSDVDSLQVISLLHADAAFWQRSQ